MLARFYVEVLGLELLERGDDRVWLACGEHCRLGIWSPGQKEHGDRGGRRVHFALSVEPAELDELAARIRRDAVVHEGPVTHGGGDRSLYVEDPAGNVVELWDYFERHGRSVGDLRA